MIGKLAANDPRLTGFRRAEQDIHSQKGHDYAPWGPIDYSECLSIALYRSIYPQPPMLQVYRESGDECLSFFELAGGMQLDLFRYKDGRNSRLHQTGLMMLSHEPRVYFNTVADTMYITDRLEDGFALGEWSFAPDRIPLAHL